MSVSLARAADAECLSITLELANARAVPGDCVVVRATVANVSDRPVTLDNPFDVGTFGPQFEARRSDTPYQHVYAVGQGTGSSTGRPTVLGPGQQRSQFAVLDEREIDEHERTLLFTIAGEYELRVGVCVNERMTWSESKKCQVVAGKDIEWAGRERAIRDLLSGWVWGKSSTDPALADLPDGSMMKTLATLGSGASAVLSKEDTDRSRWAKLKGPRGTVLADYAAEELGRILLGKKRYLEAIDEFNSMKRKTDTALNLTHTAKQCLQNPKAIVPVQ